ncbi:zinc finger protein OZF-like [Anthonomus grandis grandis]|uniref:zinc finger protein OZF-like n=1 Tax=Anthonomus grandis grandis TaxID=2921223 RepID=UPI002165D60C|nr:zinc finger protein OZF-like [Anthonomus grandis grandis]
MRLEGPKWGVLANWLTVKPDLDAEEIYIQIVNDNNTDENKIEVEELENVPFSEEIKEEEEEEEDDEENELEEGDLDESSSSPKPLAGKRSCNVCKQSYKFLSRHLEKHGSENCMDCLLNFPTSEKLAEHMQEVHNASTNYQCEVCDLTFSSLVQLGVHTFKHTKTYSCPLCNYTAKGNHKHSLINHIKRHEGKYSVFCDICGRGFFDKNILASHMEIHEDIPKYECEFCKKKFTVKRYLEVHKSLNHKKELFGIEESFQCEICGRNFTFEKSLIRHLSAIHKIGEDRRVNCPVCNKKIANNHNLKKHMRTHTGEKRFCCDECGKAFSEKKYLQKHQAGHVRQEERKRLFLEREKEKAARTRRMNRINRMRHQQMIREYQPPSPLSPPVAHPSFQERQELLQQQQQQLYQPSPQEYLNMMYRQQLLQGLNDPVGQDQEGFAFYSYDDE